MADLSKTRDSQDRGAHQGRLTASQSDLINREGEAIEEAGTVITMRGYPSGQAQVVGPRSVAAFAMLQWSCIQEKPRFEPFDPATEFLTPFVAATQGMHARGFSGAGVWFDRPTDSVDMSSCRQKTKRMLRKNSR
jgi:hypothetical protein